MKCVCLCVCAYLVRMDQCVYGIRKHLHFNVWCPLTIDPSVMRIFQNAIFKNFNFSLNSDTRPRWLIRIISHFSLCRLDHCKVTIHTQVLSLFCFFLQHNVLCCAWLQLCSPHFLGMCNACVCWRLIVFCLLLRLCFAIWIDGFQTGFQCVCVCE